MNGRWRIRSEGQGVGSIEEQQERIPEEPGPLRKGVCSQEQEVGGLCPGWPAGRQAALFCFASVPRPLSWQPGLHPGRSASAGFLSWAVRWICMWGPATGGVRWGLQARGQHLQGQHPLYLLLSSFM